MEENPNNHRNKKEEFRLREHFVLAGENEVHLAKTTNFWLLIYVDPAY